MITNLFISAIKSHAGGDIWALSWHHEEPDASFICSSKLLCAFIRICVSFLCMILALSAKCTPLRSQHITYSMQQSPS